MRLLVIEDNRSLVANLFDYFEARGHTLDAAPDGLTGLHLAGTQVYDAIVLDWMLPRLEGPEVLRRLPEAAAFARDRAAGNRRRRDAAALDAAAAAVIIERWLAAPHDATRVV